MKTIYYGVINEDKVLALNSSSIEWWANNKKPMQVSELLYLKIINYYKQNDLDFKNDRVRYFTLYDLFKTDFDLSTKIGYLIK